MLKYLGIPTTKESHFPVSQSTVTLAETSNWQNQQLRLWVLNQISLATISTDTNNYVDAGARQARHLRNITVCVHDYHTLDISIVFI